MVVNRMQIEEKGEKLERMGGPNRWNEVKNNEIKANEEKKDKMFEESIVNSYYIQSKDSLR